MKQYTITEMSDVSGVKRETIKSFLTRNNVQPIDTSEKAYKYPADVLDMIITKYTPLHEIKRMRAGDPSVFEQTNSLDEVISQREKEAVDKLMKNAMAVADKQRVKSDEEMKKQFKQFRDYVNWRDAYESQTLAPAYNYRKLLTHDDVKSMTQAMKLYKYFDGFYVKITSQQLRLAVKNGDFKRFVDRLQHIERYPMTDYVMVYRFNHYSANERKAVITALDNYLTKHSKSYHDFQPKVNQGPGATALGKTATAKSVPQPGAKSDAK